MDWLEGIGLHISLQEGDIGNPGGLGVLSPVGQEPVAAVNRKN